MIRKFFKLVFISIFLVGVIGAIGGTLTGFYFYFRLTRDLPRIERLSDYTPKAVSFIYAADGTLMAELFDERRYPVKFEEVPPLVRHAFLAAEDSSFYSHPGVDVISIFRAVWVNFKQGGTKQGASTITQQVVKSLLLTREKKFERKIKEAILSYRLEKALTKDEIFTIYLNEIFLGNHAYGIKAAARVHFHKELDQLSIAEAAFLAGLPQRPSQLMNPKNRSDALARQKYVLNQMLANRMITAEELAAAKEEKLTIYPPNNNGLYHAPYYVSHAMTVAEEALQTVNPRFTLKNPGGFSIHTAADLKAYDMAERAVHRGLEELDKRRGWRGPTSEKGEPSADLGEVNSFVQTKAGIAPLKIYKAKVTSFNKQSGAVAVRVGEFDGSFSINEAGWAKRFINKAGDVTGIDPAKSLSVGQIVEVSLKDAKNTDPIITDPTTKLSLKLDQTPEVESAFVVNNVWTGEVVAIIGGYDYAQSNFNRATQGRLQPGSSFKPFIYVAALDALHFTPTTLVPDSPISLVAGNGKVWTPGNFDGKFLGPITLRKALEKSRNVVSVYLLMKLGVERGIQSARNLGITTPIDRNMSIALGTPEVIPLEMVRAYGAFAAGGRLADSLVIKSIVDRNGNKIYQKQPREQQVLNEETAFVMANMMKGVVERGTATSLKVLGKPCAGKTGTTNDHMDAWFIGYTPDWAAGAWVGYDVKRTLGKTETGGRAAGPIFLYFMQEFLANTPPLDFNIPDGVVPIAIDIHSGHPVDPADPNAFIEYFRSGSEPDASKGADPLNLDGDLGGELSDDYLSGDEF